MSLWGESCDRYGNHLGYFEYISPPGSPQLKGKGWEEERN